MGVVICFVAMFGVAPIYFPMWGGLIFPAKKGVTEEDYYYSEYSPAEREAGHHLAASNFVSAPAAPHCCVHVMRTICHTTPCLLTHEEYQHRSTNIGHPLLSVQGVLGRGGCSRLCLVPRDILTC